ncbi:MAG: hypothetical protein EBW68_09205 [Actinobacteria bacterium]|nr:hypothetical protein [Actinomycetota bacterium]
MRDFVTEMVDELLDSEGEVKIGNLTYSRSEILKAVDPIAYREVCLEVVNSEIENLQYDLDRLDPETDAEEVEDYKERIAALEEY